MAATELHRRSSGPYPNRADRNSARLGNPAKTVHFVKWGKDMHVHNILLSERLQKRRFGISASGSGSLDRREADGRTEERSWAITGTLTLPTGSVVSLPS